MNRITKKANKTVGICTLGCKVNQYESVAIGELFESKGYVLADFNSPCDVYIINTCTVTNLGDKKSRQMIRRARSKNKSAVIVACGCYAQVSPDAVAEVEGVNIVIGTKERIRMADMVGEYLERGIDAVDSIVSKLDNNMEYEDLHVTQYQAGGRTRAYVKIQDGCRQYCTYCIIPYARGPVRSRGMSDIVAELRTLGQKGFKEIVLTGIHIASYGKDLDNISLIDVLEAAQQTDGIQRIRISSIEPGIVTEQLLSKMIKLDKICDHFHLSLQSGSNTVLKRMNRRYDIEKYANTVSLITAAYPNAALWTDIICGFPGESESEFNESYDYIAGSGLHKLHVFPFSPKSGTPAARFDGQIPSEQKAARAKAMSELSDKLYHEFLISQMDRNVDVLFEENTSDGYVGHTTNYIKMEVSAQNDLVNEICTVKGEAVHGDKITARLLRSYTTL